MKAKVTAPVQKVRVPIRKMQEQATAEFSRLKQQKKVRPQIFIFTRFHSTVLVCTHSFFYITLYLD